MHPGTFNEFIPNVDHPKQTHGESRYSVHGFRSFRRPNSLGFSMSIGRERVDGDEGSTSARSQPLPDHAVFLSAAEGSD